VLGRVWVGGKASWRLEPAGVTDLRLAAMVTFGKAWWPDRSHWVCFQLGRQPRDAAKGRRAPSRMMPSARPEQRARAGRRRASWAWPDVAEAHENAVSRMGRAACWGWGWGQPACCWGREDRDQSHRAWIAVPKRGGTYTYVLLASKPPRLRRHRQRPAALSQPPSRAPNQSTDPGGRFDRSRIVINPSCARHLDAPRAAGHARTHSESRPPHVSLDSPVAIRPAHARPIDRTRAGLAGIASNRERTVTNEAKLSGDGGAGTYLARSRRAAAAALISGRRGRAVRV
jgi:hypothetical protein